MAKNLRKLYENEFNAILKDAKENTEEAKKIYQAAADDVKEKERHLSMLKETAKVTSGKFLNDSKSMLKLALARDAALDILKAIAENIMTFVSAKEAIPNVEQDIMEAKLVEGKAMQELYSAVNEENAIRVFAKEPSETE